MMDKIDYILKADITVKSLSILVTVFMLLTVVPGLTAAQKTTEDGAQTIEKQFVFSPPEVVTAKDGYVQLQVDGASETQNNPGEPTLPLCVYSFELPYGSAGVTAELTPLSVESMVLADKVIPGPVPYLVGEGPHPLARALLKVYSLITSLRPPEVAKGVQFDAMKESIYNSNAGYGEMFSYNTYVGVNAEGTLVTYVVCHIMSVTFSSVASGTLSYFTDATVKVSYTRPEPSTGSLATVEQYDLLILAPKGYQNLLQPLVTHKEAMGLKTKLVTLDEIYSNAYFDVSGLRDNQEMIKYFIYQAKLNWNVVYVLAVGGYRSYSGLNNPNLEFPVQMHYNDVGDGDPYYTCDQYYSCSVRYDPVKGAVFDDWDSNGNGRPAEFDGQGRDEFDPYPEVFFGRWACTDRKEVQTMVDKTIYYETNTYGQDWFKTLMTVSGDAFGDHPDLGQNWDTTLVPDGDYTIYGVSKVGSLYGPIDQVQITVDHSATSRVTPGNDEQNIIEPLDPEQKTKYPAKPVAEIVVPQNGDVLGNTDVGPYTPDTESEFYGGGGWADVSYVNGVVSIKAKSYDPRPHETGDMMSHTKIQIWINDSNGNMIKQYAWMDASEAFEGEQMTKTASMLLPAFNHTKIWTSNGNFSKMWDVLNAFSEGHGIVYFNGHSSCMMWGDHFPGIPGGRDDGFVDGLGVLSLQYAGLERYQSQEGDPLFPIDQLTNGNKLPITLLLGCHSGFFDTSPMRLLSDPYAALWGVGHIGYYGSWVPEGMAWRLARQPQGGSIATIGFTGMGYGGPGDLMMFLILAGYAGGNDTLGAAVTMGLNAYADVYDPVVLDQFYLKTWGETVLLGDPSLKIGGYPPKTGALAGETDQIVLHAQQVDPSIVGHLDAPMPATIVKPLSATTSGATALSSSDVKITTSLLDDKTPSFVSNSSSGKFLAGYIKEVPLYDGLELDSGFVYSPGGSIWYSVPGPWPGNQTYISVDSAGYDMDSSADGTMWDGAYATFGDQGCGTHVVVMGDIAHPETWGSITWGAWILENVGAKGVALVSGYPHPTVWPEGHWIFGQISTLNLIGVPGFDYIAYGRPCFFMPTPTKFGSGSVGWILLEHCANISGDVDQSNLYSHWALETQTGGYLTSVICDIDHWGEPGHYEMEIPGAFKHPDVAAANGYAYVAYENGSGISCVVSSDNGQTWVLHSPTVNGQYPKIVINDNGSIDCYYLRAGKMYKSYSADHGATWTETGTVTLTTVADVPYPFDVTTEGYILSGSDKDLYANIYPFTPVPFVMLDDIRLEGRGTIVANVTNTGLGYVGILDWTITIAGDSPIGRFLGSSLLYILFKGRVLSGGATSDTIALSPKESETLRSTPVFGFGHVMITVSVSYNDNVLAEKSEDAFLLGGRILLHHGVE